MASNNSNNDNNNDTVNQDPKMVRTRQEATVLSDFHSALKGKLDQIRSQVGTNGKIGFSESERQALGKLKGTGDMEGLIAGVATFVFLRRFPKYLVRRAAQRAAAQQQRGNGGGGGGGYTLDPPGGKLNSPFNNNGNMQQNSLPGLEQPQTQNRPGLIWRSFQFMLDVTISGMVGLYTSAYMMDREKIKKTVSGIPLLEGRSYLSDHLCAVLVEEYQRQWKLNASMITDDATSQDQDANKTEKTKALPPFDRKDILKNPQLELLQVYMGFTKNCMKRQAMERRIRQEKGVGPDEPVEIPSPGVNSSEWNSDGVDSFSDDDSSGDGDFYGGEKYLSGDDNEGDEWTKDDASSFVSDQEDSRK